MSETKTSSAREPQSGPTPVNPIPGMRLYDALAFAHAFQSDVPAFPQILRLSKFIDYYDTTGSDSTRPARELFQSLYERMTVLSNPNPFNFQFLHNVGLISDSALETATAWIEHPTSIVAKMRWEPDTKLVLYTPLSSSPENASARSMSDVEQLVTLAAEAKNAPVSSNLLYTWPVSRHEKEVLDSGLNELAGLKPSLDEAMQTISFVDKRNAIWTRKTFRAAQDILKRYGFSEAARDAFFDPQLQNNPSLERMSERDNDATFAPTVKVLDAAAAEYAVKRLLDHTELTPEDIWIAAAEPVRAVMRQMWSTPQEPPAPSA
jgi:hypothetical protein